MSKKLTTIEDFSEELYDLIKERFKIEPPKKKESKKKKENNGNNKLS